ncbi:hypothetical protein ACFXJO_16165 [Streptomyces lavendulae]
MEQEAPLVREALPALTAEVLDRPEYRLPGASPSPEGIAEGEHA